MTRERLANRRGIDILRRRREAWASRDKGARIEGAMVAALLRSHGLATEPVPLSGAARGRFGGEVSVPLVGFDRRVEVKGGAGGVARLYGRPAGADVLMIGADRKEPLVARPALARRVRNAGVFPDG